MISVSPAIQICSKKARLAIRLLALTSVIALCTPTNAAAATMVYIENNTEVILEVVRLSVEGDPLSKKAWKAGESKIPPGQRVSVLSINRTGKFNWMDPTPRFIEPGKTVVFTAQLRRSTSNELFTIKQKLEGTGSGSKLWFAVADPVGSIKWTLPFGEISGLWSTAESEEFQYIFRALKTSKDDNLELILQK